MPTAYTVLKGFDSISDVDIQNTIQQNVIAFFDWGFINKSAFTNVRLSQTDVRSSDRSVLKIVRDPNFANGRVWETFRENLVWEQNLNSTTQPISISGVYVNGTFVTPNTSGFQHYVDYVHGRVIFNTPLPITSTVKMEYSFKTLNFTNLQVLPLIQYVQSNSFDLSTKNYAGQSGEWGLLTKERIQMPFVSVEVAPRGSQFPTELGSNINWTDIDVIMHIVTEDQSDCMKYSSFIFAQKDLTIFMFNLTQMNKSGVMPLDYRGVPIVNAMTYDKLVRDNSDGGYAYNKLYFKDAILTGPNNIGTIYHAAVRFTMETVLLQ